MEGTQHYSVGGNVRVLARVRPALTQEYQYDQAVEVLSESQIRLQNSKQSYASSYDRVLSESSNQELVYEQVKDCVQSLLLGYNNTLLAYGQTGTGKTYTMIGDQSMTVAQACTVPSSATGHGILPRAVYELFNELEKRKAAAASRQQHFDVRLVCSYLEIYNDRLYDLLQPYKQGSSRDPHRILLGKTSLDIREDPVAGTHVPNLLYVDVQSFKQVLQLVATGNSNRATAHTDMNRHSSRRHAILQLWLEQRPSADGANSIGTAADNTARGVVVRSKMNFVDLAGSERWGKAHNETEGKTLVSELTSINNSLSALALVVAALTDKAARHIPYRSSRLTHLLQDSLGGNCNTTLIVTVAPCIDAFEDSMAALKFADRARNISNRAVVNSMHDTETILALKEREIQRLRALLASYTSTSGGAISCAGPGTQPPWQHWAQEGIASQDALIMPKTHPSTPNSPTSAPAAPQDLHSRVPSHLGGSSVVTAPVEGSSDVTTGSTCAEALASAATAINKAQLESDLAAARAALALERTLRSALEGQLQEVSAAVQAQQQAAAVAAAAAQAEQQAAAATAAAAARKSMPPSALSGGDCNNQAAAQPSVELGDDCKRDITVVGRVVRTGRSTLLAHSTIAAAAALEPAAPPLDQTWPVLSSPKQLQQYMQLSPEHFSTLQQQKQQHSHGSSTKKPKASKWNDNWQGSAEERIRASHHHQQEVRSTRSSTTSPVEVAEPDRLRMSAGKDDKGSSKVGTGKSAAGGATMPLRKSWSEAYGASGGLKGKWPQSIAASGNRNGAVGSSKAMCTSPAGCWTARESAAVASTAAASGWKRSTRYHSQTPDAADPMSMASGQLGVVQGPQRSVSPVRPFGGQAAAQPPVPSSRALMQHRAAAGELPVNSVRPLMDRPSGNAVQQLAAAVSTTPASKQHRGLLSTTVTAGKALGRALHCYAVQEASYAGSAEQLQQQTPGTKGWGRSSLLQQPSTRSQIETAAASVVTPAVMFNSAGTAVHEMPLQQPADSGCNSNPCAEDFMQQQQQQQSGSDRVSVASPNSSHGQEGGLHDEHDDELQMEGQQHSEQLKMQTADSEVPEGSMQCQTLPSLPDVQQQQLEGFEMQKQDNEQVSEQYSDDFAADVDCNTVQGAGTEGARAAGSMKPAAGLAAEFAGPTEEVATASTDDPVIIAGSGA